MCVCVWCVCSERERRERERERERERVFCPISVHKARDALFGSPLPPTPHPPLNVVAVVVVPARTW